MLCQTGLGSRVAELAAQRDKLAGEVGIEIFEGFLDEFRRQRVEIARATAGRFKRPLMRAG